jgi:hypothetical protein
MKTKLCRCGKDYSQYTSLQNCCIDCLAVKVAKKRINSEKVAKKVQSRELKAAKEKMKPLGFFKAKAQAALNKWVVHVRDKGKGCVSCGKVNVIMQGGHYLARSIRPELALIPENINAQCIHCNLFNKNAHHAYRKELINRIGIDKVEWLESNHEPKKYTKQDFLDIEAEYKQKLKDMK